ncbi:MATE family efflux transporter [Aminipila terrae]|uniref:MATE family efflux transporter n=1 Tax=Aminipila terrae TaxID=2697030 RepID=A0A6P1MLX0_9FIRM|nr:MATE family efflux transporter [Aminipila terrae]QHI73664.1 MATE family efflux transporter [Aminipila terrae]
MNGENKMGTMPVGKLMLSMSWPAMLSMMIQALYNVIDSIFVAMISESSLTAVTLIFPIQMLLISVAVGTGVGVNSLIARRLGAKRFEEADLAASHGFRIAFINWAVFAIMGLLFSKTYISAYSDSPYIIENGALFLMITTGFSLFVFIQVNTEKVLQATGSMLLPMLCSLSGAIINIVLDPFLIFGIGFFPKMGVAGAAIATTFGQFISMCLGLTLLFGRKHQVTVKIKGFKFNGEIIKDIYNVGFPAMLMQSIGSVMLFCINGILAFSETAVAVLGSYFRLQSFIFMPVFGLNQGAMPIMGYNYGARNKERLMQAYKVGIIIAAIIMTIGTIIFLTFPEQLLKMFSASDNMLKIGVPALRTICLCFIPAAFGILTSTIFQATGHGMLSMWQALIRQLIGIVPLAWILLKIGGLTMVWWAWPMAEILGLVYSLIFVKKLYKKEIEPLGHENEKYNQEKNL